MISLDFAARSRRPDTPVGRDRPGGLERVRAGMIAAQLSASPSRTNVVNPLAIRRAESKLVRARMLASAIGDLVVHPKVVETRSQIHHSVSKQEHLLRSARYSYRLAGMLGADRRVCARAAVLHDLDSRSGTLSSHGLIAARLALEMGESETVCRAIMPHMFPFGPAPRSREGWVLVLADKMASLSDLTHFVIGLFRGQGLRRRRQLQGMDPYFRTRRKKRIGW